MESGIKSNKKEILRKIKVGDYIKWRPLPLDGLAESAFVEFKDFVGIGNEWEYGLVLDILERPRNKNDMESIRGLHIKLLKGNETDWIFNFELFNEIEIIGSTDKD